MDRGHRVVVWFFCGCAECAECARAWAQMQRSGVVNEAAPTSTGSKTPIVPLRTLVVFSGGRDETQAFAGSSLLDSRQTVFLADTDLEVTQTTYHVTTCPRVFVLDAQGKVRYSNAPPADTSPKAPAEGIVAQVLSTLRALPSQALPIPPRNATPPHNQSAPRHKGHSPSSAHA